MCQYANNIMTDMTYMTYLTDMTYLTGMTYLTFRLNGFNDLK